MRACHFISGLIALISVATTSPSWDLILLIRSMGVSLRGFLRVILIVVGGFGLFWRLLGSVLGGATGVLRAAFRAASA